jgi:hypothetical protein
MAWGQDFQDIAAARVRQRSPLAAALAAASGAGPAGTIVESVNQPHPDAIPVADVFPNHPNAIPAGNAGITHAMLRQPDPQQSQWTGVPAAAPQGESLSSMADARGTVLGPMAGMGPPPPTLGEKLAAGAKGFLMQRAFPGAQAGIDRMLAQRALVPYVEALEGRLDFLQANPTPQNQERRLELAYAIAKSKADQSPYYLRQREAKRVTGRKFTPEGDIEHFVNYEIGGQPADPRTRQSLGIEGAPNAEVREIYDPIRGNIWSSDFEGKPTARPEREEIDFLEAARQASAREVYEATGGDAKMAAAFDKGRAYKDNMSGLYVYGGQVHARQARDLQQVVSSMIGLQDSLAGLVEEHPDADVSTQVWQQWVAGPGGFGTPGAQQYITERTATAGRLAAALEGGKLTNQDIERQLARMARVGEAVRGGKLSEVAKRKMSALWRDIEAGYLARFRPQDKEAARRAFTQYREEQAEASFIQRHGREPTDEELREMTEFKHYDDYTGPFKPRKANIDDEF